MLFSLVGGGGMYRAVPVLYLCVLYGARAWGRQTHGELLTRDPCGPRPLPWASTSSLGRGVCPLLSAVGVRATSQWEARELENPHSTHLSVRDAAQYWRVGSLRCCCARGLGGDALCGGLDCRDLADRVAGLGKNSSLRLHLPSHIHQSQNVLTPHSDFISEPLSVGPEGGHE